MKKEKEKEKKVVNLGSEIGNATTINNGIIAFYCNASLYETLSKHIQNNRVDIIKRLVDNKLELYYDYLLEKAVIAGNVEIVKLILTLPGIDCHDSLAKAIELNNRKMINILKDEKCFSYDKVLCEAIRLEDRSLMTKFKNKFILQDCWNTVLITALEVENTYMVNFAISKGADDWTGALIASMDVENKEYIERFKKKDINWRRVSSANMDIWDRNIMRILIDMREINYFDLLNGAVKRRDREFIDIALEETDEWECPLEFSLRNGDEELIDVFVRRGLEEFKSKLLSKTRKARPESMQYLKKRLESIALT